jgi:hypothetical protein
MSETGFHSAGRQRLKNEVTRVAAVASTAERVTGGDDEHDEAEVAARAVPGEALNVGKDEVAQTRIALFDRLPVRHERRLALGSRSVGVGICVFPTRGALRLVIAGSI